LARSSANSPAVTISDSLTLSVPLERNDWAHPLPDSLRTDRHLARRWHHRGPWLVQGAADSGLSVRQLERHFDAVVGVSPKQLLRIVRFNSARRALVSSPSTPLLEVAYTSRYADYSHMSRDFKEFFGITPRDFLEWIRPHATRTGADPQDVVFLQDDAVADSLRWSA
jgi:AraC-like DNA-binding protein